MLFRSEKPVQSATLLTTLVDFTDTGVLDVFIDENFVRFREMQFSGGGLLKGQDLASTFSFLRPNDLVWNYVVGNYLKGETPPPFDLLYWNSDSTNLPGRMYAWYLRNTYLENNLVKPGKVTVCDQKIDLRKVDLPIYIYGSREDHIVPIGGAYASTQWFPGKKRFVMGASGHIAGVVNPPAANKYCHWTFDGTPAEFIDVVSSTPSRDQDPHWRRQADHLGLEFIRYDDVIHLEDLDASWPQIAKLTGVPDLQEQFFCKNSTGARSRLAEFYTPELLIQVGKAYAHDYGDLNYEPPSLTGT